MLLALVPPSARALDPDRVISQFGHTTWRSLDGELPGSPWAITQTSDGYLWVGTDMGLARSDGVRFRAFSPPADGGPPPRTIFTLAPAADGSLWIGRNAGLDHWDGKTRAKVELQAKPAGIAIDAAGDVWTARSGSRDGRGPMCRLHLGVQRCYGTPDGVSFPFAASVVAGRDGSVWFASATTVDRMKDGRVSEFHYRGKGLSDFNTGADALALARDGSLWVGFSVNGAGMGLQRLVDGAWQAVDRPGFSGESLRVSRLLLDRHDTLWVGTANDGVYRIGAHRVDHFRKSDGLSGDTVNALFEDSEGNVWIGTSNGLDRLRDVRVATWSTQEGLSEDSVNAIATGPDGDVWVASSHSLDAVHPDGSVSRVLPRGTLQPADLTDVFEDRSGRVWLGIDGALGVLEDGRVRRIPLPDGQPLGTVIDITQDRRGAVWALAIGKPNRLVRVEHDRVVEDVSAQLRDSDRLIPAADGGLWLSDRPVGIAHLKDGQASTSPLGRGVMVHLAESADGALFGATARGVVVKEKGRERTMTTDDGLPCNGLATLVFDRHGALWLYSACGLLRVRADELAAWRSGALAKLHPDVFDATDGAQPQFSYFGLAAIRSPDGRLWFCNGTHLQMVDPDRLTFDTVAPRMHVEGLVADRIAYPGGDRLQLPPRIRDLEIDYSALSFSTPQKVLFRYRLEGHDDAWQGPVTRRQAFYTDLAPGHYRFHVVACNGEGVWNDEGAALAFDIPPTFVQTRWFILLCAFGACLLMGIGFRWRVRQLAAGFRVRLDERERIARELHDTLLQSTQGIVLIVQGVVKRLATGDPNKASLEEAVVHADAVIAEGRDRIQALRESDTAGDDLLASIDDVGQRLAGLHGIAFRSSRVGSACRLRPDVHGELMRIATEALTNAFQHARATLVEVVYVTGQRRLGLTVRDDGAGLPPGMLGAASVPGHWGLSGMRERAAHLRARLRIESTPAAGTSVTLSMPMRRACEPPGRVKAGGSPRA